jgi:hypothetical protein
VQVAQQIRAAQQKAALSGQAPPAWAIGAKCHALSPLDGDWGEAVVRGISAGGNFVVAFTGREDLEEVRFPFNKDVCAAALGRHWCRKPEVDVGVGWVDLGAKYSALCLED